MVLKGRFNTCRLENNVSLPAGSNPLSVLHTMVFEDCLDDSGVQVVPGFGSTVSIGEHRHGWRWSAWKSLAFFR